MSLDHPRFLKRNFSVYFLAKTFIAQAKPFSVKQQIFFTIGIKINSSSGIRCQSVEFLYPSSSFLHANLTFPMKEAVRCSPIVRIVISDLSRSRSSSFISTGVPQPSGRYRCVYFIDEGRFSGSTGLSGSGSSSSQMDYDDDSSSFNSIPHNFTI